jgi:hypothetical protein
VRNVTAAECLPHRKRLAEASEMISPHLRHLVEATERSNLRVVLIGANLLVVSEASLVAMIGPAPMPEIPAGIEKKIVTPQ